MKTGPTPVRPFPPRRSATRRPGRLKRGSAPQRVTAGRPVPRGHSFIQSNLSFHQCSMPIYDSARASVPEAGRCHHVVPQAVSDPQLRDGPLLPRRRVPRSAREPARTGSSTRSAASRSRSSPSALRSSTHEKLDLIVKSGELKGHAQVLDLEDGQRALVWVDRRFARILPPGQYAYWTNHREVRVEVVDAQPRTVRARRPEGHRPQPVGSRAARDGRGRTRLRGRALPRRPLRRARSTRARGLSGRARPRSVSWRSTSARRRSTCRARRS